MPLPVTERNAAAGGRSSPSSRARSHDRLAQRVLGADLGRRGQPQQLSLR